MKYFVSITSALAIAAACFFIAPNADAQSYYNKSKTTKSSQIARDKTPSKAATSHAGRVADVCPEHWETPECLSAVSESNLVLVANYGATLDKRGKKKSLEQLKEHCAASTAGSRGDYPAYAMRSAFVECANIIVDISNATRIEPDKSHYQILVGSVLCLDEDRRCSYVEEGLNKY